jgi:murein endopeptidase
MAKRARGSRTSKAPANRAGSARRGTGAAKKAGARAPKAATRRSRASGRALAASDAAFVRLPQASGNGYYTYSAADRQFGTAKTIEAIVDVGKQWQLTQADPFGAGDISFAQGGHMPPHTTGHRIGRNIDVRPMRKDGQAKPVTFRDAAYSRERTQILVDTFRAHRNCTKIIFNDPGITGVQPLAGHDNHLHIQMKE